MRMVQDRDQADPARRWGFVFAIARTWKTAEEKTIKNLVTHVPHAYDQRTRVPTEQARQRRKTLWTFHTRLCLRHIGEVTVVLSKRGRTLGPKQTKILVTNLAELTSSHVVCIYQKRWAMGVSSQGSLTQSVQVRPRPRDSGLVAREAPGRESKPVKPSDNTL